MKAHEADVQGLLMSHEILVIGKPEVVPVLDISEHLALVLGIPEHLELVLGALKHVVQLF